MLIGKKLEILGELELQYELIEEHWMPSDEEGYWSWALSYNSEDNMACIYGATYGMQRFLRVVGMIELDDFITEFGACCNGQSEKRLGFHPYST